MIAVIQRVKNATVHIDNQLKSSINKGLLILIGICTDDNIEDIQWLAQKIAQMRIFSDENQKMNLCVNDIKGEMLVVSQFTLLASTKKGNRPSFIEAAKPTIAIPLYEQFIQNLQLLSKTEIKTGTFGADMQIKLVNDGPVTIIIDSKNKI